MLRAYWHRLFHRPVKASCRGPALPRCRRPRATRPTLEVLEGRVTPSSVTYYNARDVGVPVTGGWQGIRGADTEGQYLISGTSRTHGLLFVGSIAGNGQSYFVDFPGASSTSVYGPNNLGGNRIQLVGSYTSGHPLTDPVVYHGFLFQGTTADLPGGYFRTIDYPGATFNFVHSTMGGLAVGNYDGPTGSGSPLGPGQDYIYNIATRQFVSIVYPGSFSNTAYGIWYNGGTSYTICGGYSKESVNNMSDQSQPIGQGYLVDYNSATGQFSHWTPFSYPNGPAGTTVLTHFEGISEVQNGVYTLAADSLQSGSSGNTGVASFVTVRRNPDGSFGKGTWVDLNYPGAVHQSSDSVYGNNVVGVAFGTAPPTRGFFAYQATVHAGTFLVTNSSDDLLPGSLRYAIAQANNMAGNGGSTVEITPQVTSPIVLTNGELPINASMTIRNDSGAPVEIRQDTPDARVFHVTGPGALDVAVTGLTGAVTIDGGSVHDNGGGFLVDNPRNTLTLTDVEVVGNSATDGLEGGGNGGGIYSRGAVVLRGSVVGTTDAPNRATQLAGGVFADRGLTLQASRVDGNVAGADGGGAVVGHGNITLTDVSSISYNQAPDGLGGGLIVLSGSVFVTGGSHVDGNAAKNSGGIVEGRGNVTVLDGSTVNENSSTGHDPSAGDMGGGGIVVALGDCYISGSQVSNNHTVGMLTGGIGIVVGNVTVTDGSQVNGNTNAGPGGGIAANFLGTVTVTGHSQVNGNTGAAIGGGIVNFGGPLQGVNISAGSQVNDNVLTNKQSLGQAIAVFFSHFTLTTRLADLAAAVGGAGGADLLRALRQVEGAARQLAPLIRQAANELPEPPGLLVTGGGVGTLLAPISVTGGSQVDGNLSGQRVRGGNRRSVGLGGGVFSTLAAVTIDHSAVDGNRAPYGAGGGVMAVHGALTIAHSTINGNSAAGAGGGIWSGSSLLCYASTVADNTAGGAGGGLFNALGGQAMVLGSEFRGNQAALGGGLANLGTLAVVGSTVAENQAAVDGGGIWSGQQLLLLDVLFADNSPNDVAWF